MIHGDHRFPAVSYKRTMPNAIETASFDTPYNVIKPYQLMVSIRIFVRVLSNMRDAMGVRTSHDIFISNKEAFLCFA